MISREAPASSILFMASSWERYFCHRSSKVKVLLSESATMAPGAPWTSMAKRLKAPYWVFSVFSFSVRSAKVLKPRPISQPGWPWSDGLPGYSLVPSPKYLASSQVFAGESAEKAQTAFDMEIPLPNELVTQSVEKSDNPGT